MSILIGLQIISTLIIITYYSMSIYIGAKQDAVNHRVLKYAWFHVRDKWTDKLKNGWKKTMKLLSSEPKRMLQMDDFQSIDPIIDNEEIIKVGNKSLIVI